MVYDMTTLRLKLLLLFSLSIPGHAFATGDSQRIVVISDINGRYASTDYHPRVATAIQRIVALEPDIVISTGDMIAGQRPTPKLQQAELSAMYTLHDQPPACSTAVMVSPIPAWITRSAAESISVSC